MAKREDILVLDFGSQYSIAEVKEYLRRRGVPVRPCPDLDCARGEKTGDKPEGLE